MSSLPATASGTPSATVPSRATTTAVTACAHRHTGTRPLILVDVMVFLLLVKASPSSLPLSARARPPMLSIPHPIRTAQVHPRPRSGPTVNDLVVCARCALSGGSGPPELLRPGHLGQHLFERRLVWSDEGLSSWGGLQRGQQPLRHAAWGGRQMAAQDHGGIHVADAVQFLGQGGTVDLVEPR